MSRRDHLPLPPPDARVDQTVCQYCTVGCGYTVYTWPVGRSGGPAPKQNALGVDFNRPQPALTGVPYTEAMHRVAVQDGRAVHVAIIPAADSPINLQRDHSSRGGAAAEATFATNRATRARLHTPLLRIGDTLQPVPWDEAIALLAAVVAGVRDRFGADALTAKAFDHGGGGGGFENNWAVGRLLFDALKMQHVAIHNRPAYNSEVWGSRDRGVHELHYTAEDGRLADTLVLWGANPYETASVFATSHLIPNFQGATADEKRAVFANGEPIEPTRWIVIDPRKTSTVALPMRIDRGRVLHLRPKPGTDYVLADALARVVYEAGWHDRAMLEGRTDERTWPDYAKRSLKLDRPADEVLDAASRITGVSVADMRTAARWMAQPKAGGHRRRTLTLYEKGLIWNYKNYDTVAAAVQLSVLAGNIGRPGTGCGRQGGHQEGYVRPAYPGKRPPVNIDQHLIDGQGKLFWVLGTNPYRSTPRAQEYRKRVHARTQALSEALGARGESATVDARAKAIVDALASGDGLFMVVNELYLTDTAADAHLVLPAAGWGEADLTSINCNSRLLRLYPRFVDPPGVARPDWWIMGQVGQAMGFEGFDWPSAEAVFLDGAESFPDNRVDAAGAESLPAETYAGVTYAELRARGQQGIQTPVRRDPETGALVGTVRRYGTRFGTADGRFKWYGSDPWTGYPPEIARYFEGDRAQRYPLWLTTGRNQFLWQTGYHDQHQHRKMEQVPFPYIEVHPDDARAQGLDSGDLVEVFNEEGNATFQVRVCDSPPPGMVFALQYHPKGTANALTTRYTDPKTTIPWYKGSRVGLRTLSGQLASAASLRPVNVF